MTGIARLRLLVALLAGLLVLGASAGPAAASGHRRDGALLGDFWKVVLEHPAEHNPYLEATCLRFDGVLTPFIGQGSGQTRISCDVRPGEPVFVTALTYEWSAYEESTSTDPQPPTERRLREVAVSQTGTPPASTLDGRPLTYTKALSRLTTARLPQDNIFGIPGPTTTTFVAAGWVRTLRFDCGTHTITITAPVNGVMTTFVTTIRVVGRR